jgi:hypothetical protein
MEVQNDLARDHPVAWLSCVQQPKRVPCWALEGPHAWARLACRGKAFFSYGTLSLLWALKDAECTGVTCWTYAQILASCIDLLPYTYWYYVMKGNLPCTSKTLATSIYIMTPHRFETCSSPQQGEKRKSKLISGSLTRWRTPCLPPYAKTSFLYKNATSGMAKPHAVLLVLGSPSRRPAFHHHHRQRQR